MKPTAARRRRERDARRRLILDAARAVFAGRGFRNASVEAIAARAELAVGTLYRYFQSKEELYVSLLFEAMAMFHERIEAIRASSAPPDAQLQAIWQFFYDFYQEQPEYYRVFMFLHSEGLRQVISAEVLDEINQRAAENFRLVAGIVQAGVAAGLYQAELDARGVVDVLWSLLVGLVQLAETRRNLGVRRGNSLETLHREAFAWIERGLRR
ncbi:MAG: TetR/AcrR family transcriptional regulator [Anaerolineae bacterium]